MRLFKQSKVILCISCVIIGKCTCFYEIKYVEIQGPFILTKDKYYFKENIKLMVFVGMDTQNIVFTLWLTLSHRGIICYKVLYNLHVSTGFSVLQIILTRVTKKKYNLSTLIILENLTSYLNVAHVFCSLIVKIISKLFFLFIDKRVTSKRKHLREDRGILERQKG